MQKCKDERCEVWTSTDPDLCYGHAKVRDGLITGYYDTDGTEESRWRWHELKVHYG